MPNVHVFSRMPDAEHAFSESEHKIVVVLHRDLSKQGSGISRTYGVKQESWSRRNLRENSSTPSWRTCREGGPAIASSHEGLSVE